MPTFAACPFGIEQDGTLTPSVAATPFATAAKVPSLLS